jgi:glucuronokinase
MIETFRFARAGMLGNPSDGYFGKTLSFAMSNWRARVLIYPSGRLEITPSKADLPVSRASTICTGLPAGAVTTAGSASSRR